MSLRTAAFASIAVVGLTAALAAQGARPATAGRRDPARVQAKSVFLTGCVVQGFDADHYRLANAVRREEPPASAARVGASASVGSDKVGASDRTGPYDMQGGEFKAHLGHTVEIAGTDATASKASGVVAAKSAAGRQALPAFNVLSVKMVSTTCS